MDRLIAPMLRVDRSLLIGRDAHAYADDIAALDDDGCGIDLRNEIDAMLDLIQARSAGRHAPTRSRTMASELVAPLALACGTLEVVDLMHNLAIDWIDGLGDVRRFAARLHAGLDHARDLLNATLVDPSPEATAEYDSFREEMADVERASEIQWTLASNARALFRVHSATALCAVLDVHRRTPQIVAIVTIDDDGPPQRLATPTPDLVA